MRIIKIKKGFKILSEKFSYNENCLKFSLNIGKHSRKKKRLKIPGKS